MSIISMFLKEMEQEAYTTKKMLSRVPDDKYDWKPHPKSMTLRQLSTHIAELPTWVSMVLNTNELDFASAPYNPVIINNSNELMAYFEKSLEDGRTHLSKATDADLQPTWTLRNGAEIYSSSTRGEFIRITYCQIVHHRAQLGVYLRLLDIPIPGSYGPSADEASFK
ncbi:MAG: DinB family protein [Chitinophagaceae bacterium]|nr:DinB family protein [Chitinophagaceae bacterium]